MAATSIATGRATASQVDARFIPSRRGIAKPPVVYMHTGAFNATEAVSVGFPAVGVILSKLCDEGYTIVAGTQDVASFAKDVGGQDRITDAIAYCRTLGASASPAILIGGSMGSTDVLRYAGLNPSLVACVITWLTVACLDYAYQNDLGSNQAGIGTAYGKTFPQALPSTADPAGATLTAALTGKPMQLWHSSDDAYSDGASPFAAFASATGAEVHSVGAQGHTNASIALTDISLVFKFIEAHS